MSMVAMHESWRHRIMTKRGWIYVFHAWKFHTRPDHPRRHAASACVGGLL